MDERFESLSKENSMLRNNIDDLNKIIKEMILELKLKDDRNQQLETKVHEFNKQLEMLKNDIKMINTNLQLFDSNLNCNPDIASDSIDSIKELVKKVVNSDNVQVEVERNSCINESTITTKETTTQISNRKSIVDDCRKFHLRKQRKSLVKKAIRTSILWYIIFLIYVFKIIFTFIYLSFK